MARSSEVRRDWLEGRYVPLARMAQKEGDGPCGWRQAADLTSD